MKLSDLRPSWIGDGGGIKFLCPHCQKIWLTCVFVPMTFKEWCKAVGKDYGDGFTDIVPVKLGAVWQIAAGSTFDDLSVVPSIDASASGHWHGFITVGSCV